MILQLLVRWLRHLPGWWRLGRGALRSESVHDWLEEGAWGWPDESTREGGPTA